MLKHMVFSQKNAARKKKCVHMAETNETTTLLVLKLIRIRFHIAQSTSHNIQNILGPALKKRHFALKVRIVNGHDNCPK
jgi:hypothetical protein